MSLSECMYCGGHIPLGPNASNICVDCGSHVMGGKPNAGYELTVMRDIVWHIYMAHHVSETHKMDANLRRAWDAGQREHERRRRDVAT